MYLWVIYQTRERVFHPLSKHPRSGWGQNVFIHSRYLDRVAQFIMVTELSGVQFGLKSYAWFEITSMISDQIARQEVNYHFIASILKLLKDRTCSVQIFYWCSAEPVRNYIHSFFWGGGGVRVLETKVSKIATWYSFIFLQFDWLL